MPIDRASEDGGVASRGLIQGFAVVAVLAAMSAGMAIWPVYTLSDRALLGQGDNWLWYGPQAFYLDHSLHNGSFPLWNGHLLCGTPYAASPQTSSFYPPHLIRAALTAAPSPLRTHVGLTALMAAHLWMAGYATYLLARQHGMRSSGALVAAMAFAFSSGMSRHAWAHWTLIATASWFPVILLFLARSRKQVPFRHALANVITAGMALGFAFLIGFPQLWAYMAVAAAAFLAFDAVLPNQGASGVVGGLTGRIGRSAGIGAVLFAVAAIVATVSILPALEYSGYSARSKEVATPAGKIDSHVFSVREILTYSAVYAGPEDKGSFYVAGAGVLILALGGVLRGGRRAVLWSGMLLVLLDCSLNRVSGLRLPIGELLQWMAPFRFEVPERALMLACLPLAMLAGAGADWVAEAPAGTKATMARGGATAIWGCLILGIVAFWFYRDAYIPFSWATIVAPALILIVTIGAIWGARGLRFRGMGYALSLLLAIELTAWNVYLLPFRISQFPYPLAVDPLWNAPKDQSANQRALDPLPNTSAYGLARAVNGYDALYIERAWNTIRGGTNDAYSKQIAPDDLYANPYAFTFLKRPFWLTRQYVVSGLPAPPQPFPPTTTVFLKENIATACPGVSAESVIGRTVSAESDSIPIAWRTPEQGDSNIIASADFQFDTPTHGAVKLIMQAPEASAFELRICDPVSNETYWRQTIEIGPGAGIIERALPDHRAMRVELTRLTGKSAPSVTHGFLLADRGDENDQISILEWSANRVELQIEQLPEARLLVFTDAMYPGWRAYVDGVETQIYLANDAFKAIAVPRGTHHIVFEFESRRVTLGAAISLAGFLFAGASVIALGRGPA